VGRFLWFIVGVATGITAMALLKRNEESKETEDFEAVADTLQKRFENLERQFGTTK
jgi:hypothetical protein